MIHRFTDFLSIRNRTERYDLQVCQDLGRRLSGVVESYLSRGKEELLMEPRVVCVYSCTEAVAFACRIGNKHLLSKRCVLDV